MSDLIIFDVGGIVLRMDFATMFAEFAKHSKHTADEIKKRFAKTAIDKHLMLGEGEEEYFDGIRAIIENYSVSDGELLRILKLCIPAQIDEMVALKRRLHEASYRIGIFSNIGRWACQYLDQELPEVLESWGGPRVFSYQAHHIKPEPAVYALFREEAGRIFYLDDKSAYLKYPVEHLGWIGIHLTCYQDFDEPIRHVGEGHQDARISGEWHEAATPADVEKILTHV